MENPGNRDTPQNNPLNPPVDGEDEISPQLVKEIADKVYALFLREMKIEGERQGFVHSNWPFEPGGRR